MRRSTTLFIGAVVSTAAAFTAALPADAATTSTTSTTFSLTGGALDITAPATADLSSFPVSSGYVSGNLGDVVVTDSRGNSGASWTASVSATAVTGSGTAEGVSLPPESVSYDPGVIGATNVTAAGVRLQSLSETPQETVAGTAGTGVNFATWNPTLGVNIPAASAIAGTYTVTLSHSVA
ncbi:hypothetical protein MXD61_23635 [Frankia sp. AgPm24]|uniref:hypothetical protein n=1 Tax=Frankia sp. AgPm24 TaxID=631128 RepID=UPI00200EC921|nr:hypothetical protein [Frankia sp. AgPm24]MCK9924821.1 hypothetical protein [Frankia sp. AgPm24]